jgi:hypothetical protein
LKWQEIKFYKIGGRFLKEAELREEAGTPAIVESIRAGRNFISSSLGEFRFWSRLGWFSIINNNIIYNYLTNKYYNNCCEAQRAPKN